MALTSFKIINQTASGFKIQINTDPDYSGYRVYIKLVDSDGKYLSGGMNRDEFYQKGDKDIIEIQVSLENESDILQSKGRYMVNVGYTNGVVSESGKNPSATNVGAQYTSYNLKGYYRFRCHFTETKKDLKVAGNDVVVDLPVTKVKYKIGNGSFKDGTISTFPSGGKYLEVEMTGRQSITVSVTITSGTKIENWFVSEILNTTTEKKIEGFQNATNNATSYQYNFPTNTQGLLPNVVNIRPNFSFYAYLIQYQDASGDLSAPYETYGANAQQVDFSSKVIYGFFEKISDYVYFPAYLPGNKGSWIINGNVNNGTQGGVNRNISSDTTYKAKYVKTGVTIKLNIYREKKANADIGKVQPVDQDSAGKYSIPVETHQQYWTPTKTGYTLLGYTNSVSSNVIVYPINGPWEFTWEQGTTREYDLYPIWGKTYYATFKLDANGGYFDQPSITSFVYEDTIDVLEGQEAKKFPNLPTPSRAEYKFKGWSSTKNGAVITSTSKFNYGDENTEYTLYAIWQKPYSYEVTYKAGSGAWSDGATSKVDKNDFEISGSSYSYALCGTTKFGTPISNKNDYVFYRWYEEGNSNVDYLEGSTRTLTFSDDNPTVKLTFVAKYTYDVQKGGGVYIKNKYAIPYIYTQGQWVKVEPYVYTGGKWKLAQSV